LKKASDLLSELSSARQVFGIVDKKQTKIRFSGISVPCYADLIAVTGTVS
jgi:hypothetical protein